MGVSESFSDVGADAGHAVEVLHLRLAGEIGLTCRAGLGWLTKGRHLEVGSSRLSSCGRHGIGREFLRSARGVCCFQTMEMPAQKAVSNAGRQAAAWPGIRGRRCLYVPQAPHFLENLV